MALAIIVAPAPFDCAHVGGGMPFSADRGNFMGGDAINFANKHVAGVAYRHIGAVVAYNSR